MYDILGLVLICVCDSMLYIQALDSLVLSREREREGGGERERRKRKSLLGTILHNGVQGVARARSDCRGCMWLKFQHGVVLVDLFIAVCVC